MQGLCILENTHIISHTSRLQFWENVRREQIMVWTASTDMGAVTQND
jgi:hypothetical protein